MKIFVTRKNVVVSNSSNFNSFPSFSYYLPPPERMCTGTNPATDPTQNMGARGGPLLVSHSPGDTPMPWTVETAGSSRVGQFLCNFPFYAESAKIRRATSTKGRVTPDSERSISANQRTSTRFRDFFSRNRSGTTYIRVQ